VKKQKLLSKLAPQDFENCIKEIEHQEIDDVTKSVSIACMNFASNLMVDLKANKITISELKKAFAVVKSDSEDSAANDNNLANEKTSSLENSWQKKRNKSKSKRKGGKRSFADYSNIPAEDVKHESLDTGDICPDCGIGKLYKGADGKALCINGGAPLNVSRYKIECLRCNGCGRNFKAKFNKPKWSNSAKTSCILSRLHGIPFYRLSKLQDMYGMGLSHSTIWMQCLKVWEEVGNSIFEELRSEIALSHNLYCDDTGAKILEFYGSERACHTTVVCGERSDGEQLLLYITKNNYCGENIAPLMVGHKNLMSDASSMNKPHVDQDQLSKIVMFYCLYHGQAKFKEIESSYPEECGYFLEQISNIYKIDREARNMPAKKRLRLHKRYSTQYVNNIYRKITELFKNRLIEPNSRLGSVMRYWRKHKKELTRFLKKSGVSLDNNVSERNLKSMILQRKNSMFFATEKSAAILSGLASIVFTCSANGISAADYLDWIQENASKASSNPSSYMPWKYRETINHTERIAA
jgi:hypothetical protein